MRQTGVARSRTLGRKQATRHTGWGLGLGLVLTLVLGGCAEDREEVVVGLITKQEENPYWVSIRHVAERTARDEGVELISATGRSDTDVASQEAAIADMVERGADGILITPVDSTALLPAIEAAREAGVVVIALDTPVDPVEAVDAYFATDNEVAGRLLGEYALAKADALGLEPRIAMLDLAPGISTGQQRHDGFLAGFEIAEDDPALVAMVDVEGDRDLARDAMAQILVDEPDVNVIYTVNEPAALGALEVLEEQGADLSQLVLVSVDGGCRTMREGVRPGRIDATAQQYPENMAREGVRAIAAYVRDGDRPSGYLDTGVELVTDDPVPEVASRNVEFGIRNCWGS
ncbi:substrate-binding domain-containing protein [Ornithinimicrobium sp. Y1694]|uniref:substrate-binding domain-containing protein n=1 Tax=Ornithinimicrobium sp. Y1694 TaxID=3418590 RepID=UPI003CE93A26